MNDSIIIEQPLKKEKDNAQKPTWICTKCQNVYPELPWACGGCQNKNFHLKNIETAVKYYYNHDPFFKKEMHNLMLKKMMTLSTELLTQTLLKKHYLYTTRDDDKAETWIYKEGIYISQGKTYIKEYCRKILAKNYTTHLCNQVISKIEADTYIEQEEFFNQESKEEICCKNGILNIVTKQITEFNPNKIFFAKIPITFNPRAICPNIEKHFKTVLKKKADAEVMFELFGYLLYKEYKIEKAIMFIGDGRNGKGKTLDLMKRFIGPENCSSVPLQQFESDGFAAGELFKKLANLSGDLDAKSLRHTGMLKQLTGRDLIAAARKFLNRVYFVNYAKLVFACNQLPKTYDTSTAFWNRWLLFEFPYTFLSEDELENVREEDKKKVRPRDPDIIAKLTTEEEMSGLLNKALEGLERILENKDFSNSPGVNDIKNTWIRKSDSFLAFCLDFIQEDYDCKIEKSELRKWYTAYCKKHKVKGQNDKVIKEALQENYGVSEFRDENGWHWEGISFKDGVVFEDLKGRRSKKC